MTLVPLFAMLVHHSGAAWARDAFANAEVHVTNVSVRTSLSVGGGIPSFAMRVSAKCVVSYGKDVEVPESVAELAWTRPPYACAGSLDMGYACGDDGRTWKSAYKSGKKESDARITLPASWSEPLECDVDERDGSLVVRIPAGFEIHPKSWPSGASDEPVKLPRALERTYPFAWRATYVARAEPDDSASVTFASGAAPDMGRLADVVVKAELSGGYNSRMTWTRTAVSVPQGPNFNAADPVPTTVDVETEAPREMPSEPLRCLALRAGKAELFADPTLIYPGLGTLYYYRDVEARRRKTFEATLQSCPDMAARVADASCTMVRARLRDFSAFAHEVSTSEVEPGWPLRPSVAWAGADLPTACNDLSAAIADSCVSEGSPMFVARLAGMDDKGVTQACDGMGGEGWRAAAVAHELAAGRLLPIAAQRILRETPTMVSKEDVPTVIDLSVDAVRDAYATSSKVLATPMDAFPPKKDRDGTTTSSEQLRNAAWKERFDAAVAMQRQLAEFLRTWVTSGGDAGRAQAALERMWSATRGIVEEQLRLAEGNADAIGSWSWLEWHRTFRDEQAGGGLGFTAPVSRSEEAWRKGELARHRKWGEPALYQAAVRQAESRQSNGSSFMGLAFSLMSDLGFATSVCGQVQGQGAEGFGVSLARTKAVCARMQAFIDQERAQTHAEVTATHAAERAAEDERARRAGCVAGQVVRAEYYCDVTGERTWRDEQPDYYSCRRGTWTATGQKRCMPR